MSGGGRKRNIKANMHVRAHGARNLHEHEAAYVPYTKLLRGESYRVRITFRTNPSGETRIAIRFIHARDFQHLGEGESVRPLRASE